MSSHFDAIIQHIVDHELFFQFTKSGGKGGQNVNKRETKAELYFDLEASRVLTMRQKQRIRKFAHPYMHDHQLIMTCQEERYQLANKTKVLQRFVMLLKKALPEPVVRIVTKVPLSSKKKAKQSKIAHSRKKQQRSHKSTIAMDL